MQTYLTYIKPLFVYLQVDPLYYGKINMDPSEKAQLHSGDKACNLSFLRANLPCNFNATPRSTQGCKE